MKRKLLLLIVTAIILITPIAAYAVAEEPARNSDFSAVFDEHGAVMLLIEPRTGSIIYANDAATSFYGYSQEELLRKKITEINTLTPAETEKEMQAAAAEDRNYFVFEHLLASGEIRTVEVYSYPVRYEDKDVLFSIIYDITDKILLEEKEKKMTAGIIISAAIIILLLLFLLIKLNRSNKELISSKNEIDNFNALRKTFIDADDSLIYLKDENLKYVFVNRAFEKFYQRKPDEIIGCDDFALTTSDFAQKRRQLDLAVLNTNNLIVDEVEWEGRVYKTNKFPVKMLNGTVGIGAYITDITKEREQMKKQDKVLFRHMILTDVLTRSFSNRQEQLDYVLHEALKLTESRHGYIYLYDEEKRQFTLNSWTKDVMQECDIVEKQSIYQLDKTGIWGEVVRQRKPIVVNDFEQPNPLKKGYPKGHVALEKYMSVPVIIDDRIVAVVGLANKDSDYDENDVLEITLLMNGVWYAVERREALETLTLERNKYLQTLISIGDGVLVVDKNGRIEMLNLVAEKITGWSIAEAYGKHYKDIFVLSHEQEGMTIDNPIEGVFRSDTIQELGNHAMLTSKDGTKFYLEDSAAPIKDNKNRTVGVVLVFRDVTEKKEQRKRIEYLSFHDALTGLYNRRFFEEELRRLDTPRNLPLSIIMGDVNGLKLANDIFGHAAGDILLQKVANVLQQVCRSDDIIARWGGDEFVLLLPKTSLKEAEAIIKRTKEELSKEKIRTINGSISMGAATKQSTKDNIIEILDIAEERMYFAKMLERSEFNAKVITTIISTLHESIPKEKEHALRVSELCEKLSVALSLPEDEIRKLKSAAFLHDIGKIVLDPDTLNKGPQQLSSNDWDEVKKHPVLGYRILKSFDATADLAESILAHHENWDGSGYPKGLKEDEIPLLARIISLAESYDRIIHDSAVHSAADESTATSNDISNARAKRETALRTIKENAGIRFDPSLVDLFVSLIEKKSI